MRNCPYKGQRRAIGDVLRTSNARRKRPDRGAESLASAIADVLNQGYAQRREDFNRTALMSHAIKQIQEEYRLKAAEESRKRKFEDRQKQLDRDAAHSRASMYSGATIASAKIAAGRTSGIPEGLREIDILQDAVSSNQRLMSSLGFFMQNMMKNIGKNGIEVPDMCKEMIKKMRR